MAQSLKTACRTSGSKPMQWAFCAVDHCSLSVNRANKKVLKVPCSQKDRDNASIQDVNNYELSELVGFGTRSILRFAVPKKQP